MKLLVLLIALTFVGCETANVAFNDKYDGDDFMLNYEYGDGNLRKDLLGSWYIVNEANQIDAGEKRGSLAYDNEVDCLLSMHQHYEADDGVTCSLLK